MSQELSFQLSLTGNFASALRPANDELGKTEGRLHKAAKSLETFEMEMGKASTGAGGFSLNLGALAKGGSLMTFDMAEGAKSVLEVFASVYEMAAKVVEKVIDLGKEMLKTAADTQDLDLAVRLDVGAEGAGNVSKLASGFESTSRFDASDMKKAMLPLLEQGISDTQLLDDMATAATDIAARRNGGMSEVQGALDAFGKIALKGEVDVRSLRSLAIGEADYFKDLGSLLGVSAKSAEQLSKEGKINSETLISVALNQIAKREGGALGKATMEAGDNLNGMWAKFVRLPDQYFEKLANSPALGKLSTAIGRALEALDPESPTGARISAALDSMINQFSTWVDQLTQEDVLNGIASGVREFADDVQIGVRVVGSFVDGLKDLFNWSYKLMEPLTELSTKIEKVFGVKPEARKGATGIAGDLNDLFNGYRQGRLSQADIQSAVSKMPESVRAQFRQRMGIPSPAHNIVTDTGAPVVDEATRRKAVADTGAAMVDEASRQNLADKAFGPARAAEPPRPIPNISIDVSIDAAGKQVSELGAEFEQRARHIVLSLLDEVDDSSGTAVTQ